MPAVLLLRHGQASFGTADYDVLSERGAAQASAAHEAIAARGVEPAVLVSGRLLRQRDTAVPWTGAGAELRIDPRWDEYDSEAVLGAHARVPASLSRTEGPAMSSREFQEILDEALLAWVAAGDDGPGETYSAFRDRVRAGLADLVSGLAKGESALVFTSGGVIAAIAAGVLGLPDSALVALNRVSVNASVTKLVAGRSGVSLVSFNEHAHLDAPGLVTYR